MLTIGTSLARLDPDPMQSPGAGDSLGVAGVPSWGGPVYKDKAGAGGLGKEWRGSGPHFCLPWPSQSLQASSSHLLFSGQSHWLGPERDQEAPSPAYMRNGNELTC